ncbi:STAS domain-containing protein [Streptacidiphilus sp. N1-12]|uniref:STAS domain-containing protein n=2 Tax=Streptacidiphilus alkalitolerans TaxID=3342712 RepID=A0ABV6VHE3_9ACTN
MSLRIHTIAGRAVVALPAEVDITNIEDVRAAARTQLWEPLPRLREIVFDLSGTTFLGTETAHLISDTRRRGRDHGVAVHVLAPSPLHRRVLECLGLGADLTRPDPEPGPDPFADQDVGRERAWLPRQRGPLQGD